MLDGVEVAGREGELKLSRKVAGVITRAVASIPETLDRVANCLEAGGGCSSLKEPDCRRRDRRGRQNRMRTGIGSWPTTPIRFRGPRTTAGS